MFKGEKFDIFVMYVLKSQENFYKEFMAQKQSRFSRRTIALFWLLLIGIVISVLIYFEQISLLYVLATISLVVLLLIVGFADLEKVDREHIEGFAGKME